MRCELVISASKTYIQGATASRQLKRTVVPPNSPYARPVETEELSD